ncbi:MAG TPA: FliH/SctL family protein [Rhizomicrobium sp.]|jgi:flagellar assembly protein FliH|nr:FliH/SctL family protein [Rhizomicrobium sp.]
MSAKKFTFDTEFRKQGDLLSNAARARQKKSYTNDEIDAMSTRARAEGIKAGQVRAMEAIASGTLDVVAALRDILDNAHNDIEVVRAEAAQVAIIAAKKLARAALASLPQAEVEAALREAMHQAIGEPRILLRASPAIAEAITERLADIAHEEGYDGRIQISADPALKGTDCRIEWRGGGAERNESAIEAALNEIITRRFEGAQQN